MHLARPGCDAEEQAQLVGIGKLDPRLSAEMLAARARDGQR